MSDVFGLLQSIPGVLNGATVTSNYVMIRCPYHGGGKEKTPSCSLSLNKPVFFCHACTEGGHISRVLTALGMLPEIVNRAVENMNFSDDIRVAQKGVLSIYRGEDPFRGRFTLQEDILDEYRLAPVDLLDAGFKKRTLQHFEVGFDYDHFRITYPIRNIYGELVGISGRTVINAEPRYKLYRTELLEESLVPEDYTMDSVKEAILWHAHITYPFLWDDEEPVVVVEGFKAAMWVWQAGFHNVVALIGAYCSPYHAELLARTRSPVLLFLDNNEAGIRGTRWAIKRILKVGTNEIYCVRYPDLRQQPDNLDEIEIRTAIERSQRYNDWNKDNKHELREDARKRQGRSWGLGRKGP